MKRLSVVLMVASVLTLFFANNAIAAGYSGPIAGTSLTYTDFTFNSSAVSVNIRNNGLAVNFSAKVQVVENGEVIMMSTGRLEGTIPASGTAALSDTIPIVRRQPKYGSLPQVQWIDMKITPVQ